MNEVIIWGIAPNTTIEQVLYTKAKNSTETKKIIELLKVKNCTNLRIQYLDISKPFNWDVKKMINNNQLKD